MFCDIRYLANNVIVRWIIVLWDMTQCSLVDKCRCLEEPDASILSVELYSRLYIEV